MKLYAERDVEKLGKYLDMHLEAITNEGLRKKSDIAAELAYRDMVIDELQAKTNDAPMPTRMGE